MRHKYFPCGQHDLNVKDTLAPGSVCADTCCWQCPAQALQCLLHMPQLLPNIWTAVALTPSASQMWCTAVKSVWEESQIFVGAQHVQRWIGAQQAPTTAACAHASQRLLTFHEWMISSCIKSKPTAMHQLYTMVFRIGNQAVAKRMRKYCRISMRCEILTARHSRIEAVSLCLHLVRFCRQLYRYHACCLDPSVLAEFCRAPMGVCLHCLQQSLLYSSRQASNMWGSFQKYTAAEIYPEGDHLSAWLKAGLVGVIGLNMPRFNFGSA